VTTAGLPVAVPIVSSHVLREPALALEITVGFALTHDPFGRRI
jgi:hypothetical protein